MKEKLSALLICIFIALSTTGFIYAQWNDLIVISNTMEFGHLTLRFVDPLHYWDIDDATKDVGKLDCYYTDADQVGEYKALAVDIKNAYPGYEAHCNFTIKNVGTLTEHVEEVVITPGTSLQVGETYLDTKGHPIGWRLDDTITSQPALYIQIHNYTGMSIVCNLLWPGDDPLTSEIERDTLGAEMVVFIAETAQECRTYSFQVNIMYEQVIYP